MALVCGLKPLVIFTLFLDAVAHGGNPQDRAASLVGVFRRVVKEFKGFATISGIRYGFGEYLMSFDYLEYIYHVNCLEWDQLYRQLALLLEKG